MTARRGRVLVVDDEPLIAAVVRRMLAREHDVESETDGAAALARLEAGARYDVILCDLSMPVVGGEQFYARLRATAPDMAARVVFVTGGAVAPGAREFLEASTNERLDKPVDVARLRALVRRYVEP